MTYTNDENALYRMSIKNEILEPEINIQVHAMDSTLQHESEILEMTVSEKELYEAHQNIH